MINAVAKFGFIFFFLVLYDQSSVLAHKHREPCKHLVLYYHDILLVDGTTGTLVNATSANTTNPTVLGDPNNVFGMMVVFNNVVTKDNKFHSKPAAKAQGFYFYDGKEKLNAWFAATLVFNSSEYKGTMTIMGADIIKQKYRDLSVVGFFMTRGVATISTDAQEGVTSFRLKMDIKLYECY